MPKLSQFFKDKNGKIVIAQSPNSPLIGFIFCKLLSFVWYGNQPKIHYVLDLLCFGFIYTWAWLEVSSGVNYFRRTLGLTVLLLVIFWRL